MLTPSGCRPRRRSAPSSSRRAAHAGVLIEPGRAIFLTPRRRITIFAWDSTPLTPTPSPVGWRSCAASWSRWVSGIVHTNGVAHAEQRRAQAVERHRSERNAQRLRDRGGDAERLGGRHRNAAFHQRIRQPIGPALFTQRQPDEVRIGMTDDGKPTKYLAGHLLPLSRIWRFCVSKRATVPSSIEAQISELISVGVFHVVARMARSISGR